MLRIYDENSKCLVRNLNIKSISVGVFDIEVFFGGKRIIRVVLQMTFGGKFIKNQKFVLAGRIRIAT